MKILIVEADKPTCECLVEVLKQEYPNVDVHCCCTYEDALREGKDCDLVILDHFTYRLSAVRHHHLTCKKFVVLSSLNRDDSRCLEKLKIDELIPKPVDLHKLINTLDKIVKQFYHENSYTNYLKFLTPHAEK